MNTLVINEDQARKGSVSIAITEKKDVKPNIVDNQFMAKIEGGLVKINTIDCKKFALREVNIIRTTAGSDDDSIVYEGTFGEVIFFE